MSRALHSSFNGCGYPSRSCCLYQLAFTRMSLTHTYIPFVPLFMPQQCFVFLTKDVRGRELADFSEASDSYTGYMINCVYFNPKSFSR